MTPKEAGKRHFYVIQYKEGNRWRAVFDSKSEPYGVHIKTFGDLKSAKRGVKIFLAGPGKSPFDVRLVLIKRTRMVVPV